MCTNIDYKTMDITEGGKAAGEAAITEFCFSTRCLQEIYKATHIQRRKSSILSNTFPATNPFKLLRINC